MRYPAAKPTRGPNRWGSTTYFDRWLFTRSTRYCPDCLAGDDTQLGRELGGAWRRTWRLPVVFACTEHRRFLDHHCPACQQPVHVKRGTGHSRWTTTSLHPTQCRSTVGLVAGGVNATPAPPGLPHTTSRPSRPAPRCSACSIASWPRSTPTDRIASTCSATRLSPATTSSTCRCSPT
ncbi:MAG: TniQ family protein [Pseudonocardia sp.]